jgi:hypothetical protein
MRLAAPVLIPLLLAVPAVAQTADEVNGRIEMVLGDHTKFEAAFAAVQAAVADEDADALAALVSYPITIRSGPEELTIDDVEAFAQHYEEIMTEEIATAITEQTYEGLFVNSDGVMFGTGQVWLSGVCADDACSDFDVRIIAIQSAMR